MRLALLIAATVLVSAQAPAPQPYELVPESLLHQLQRCEANWMAERERVMVANGQLAAERDGLQARVKDLEAKLAKATTPPEEAH